MYNKASTSTLISVSPSNNIYFFAWHLMSLSNYCIVQDSWWNHKRSAIPRLILSIWFIFTLWSTHQCCVFISDLLPLLFMNLAFASLRLLCNDLFGTRNSEKPFSWRIYHILHVFPPAYRRLWKFISLHLSVVGQGITSRRIPHPPSIHQPCLVSQPHPLLPHQPLSTPCPPHLSHSQCHFPRHNPALRPIHLKRFKDVMKKNMKKYKSDFWFPLRITDHSTYNVGMQASPPLIAVT